MQDEQLIRVKALIRFLPTEEGGREIAVRGSYRPNHNFFGPDNRFMAIGFIDLPEGVEIHPGQSAEVSITLMVWPGVRDEIYPGREWRIQEGGRLVGFGTVLEILPLPDGTTGTKSPN